MIRYRPVTIRSAGMLALCALCGAMVGASGCGSLALTNRSAFNRKLENDPDYNINGVQGPTERALEGRQWEQERADLADHGEESDKRALAEYDAAMQVFEEGKYEEAESRFHELAKSRRARYESFGSKLQRLWGTYDDDDYQPFLTYGDKIEEDAIFMTAESQFERQRYSDAQNSYNLLLKRYPSTRHLDRVTRKLFRIARYWLDFPEGIGETDEDSVQVASLDNQTSAPGKPPQRSALSRVPIFPNLTDRSRPVFDAAGRGEQALRTIWLNDATGPLADDALMLAANHNLLTADYVEAARLYSLLREQYPDSPHIKDAYLFGSHVALASYQGAAYDGHPLEEARGLKQTLLATFPELTEEERNKLEREVLIIQEAEVARLWDLVEFYQIKRTDSAVALHCYMIINRFPDSRYAEKARAALKAVEDRAARNGKPVWYAKSRQPVPDKGGPPIAEHPADVTLPPSEAKSASPNEDKGFFDRFRLRRAEQPPKLQPIDEEPAAVDLNDDNAVKDSAPASESPGRTSLY